MRQREQALPRAFLPDVRRAPARCTEIEMLADERALASLARAAHDIRDPLQAIACYVDLLSEGVCGAVSDEQRSYLRRLGGQVDYVVAIVASILTLARAARRECTLELAEIPVIPLLEQVRLLIQPHAQAAGVCVVVDDEYAPATVRGEETALVRVLANLAGNAVTATPRQGRVTLSATMIEDAVDIQVTDTGPGIRRRQLESIFEPFVQLSDGGQKTTGVGLGLTIARDLTRLMGGELLVESVVGVGSRFTVRIPSLPRAGTRRLSARLREVA